MQLAVIQFAEIINEAKKYHGMVTTVVIALIESRGSPCSECLPSVLCHALQVQKTVLTLNL